MAKLAGLIIFSTFVFSYFVSFSVLKLKRVVPPDLGSGGIAFYM